MFLPQRFNYFSPPQFANDSGSDSTDSALLGSQQKMTIDRTWPIEEIILTVDFKIGTTALTLQGTVSTPDTYENILQLIQHVNLTVNDGKQPRSVVDADGVALMEYATLTGINIDQATSLLAAYQQTATLPTGSYTLTIRIPMVETWIGEPLRSRMYLPVHTYPQDPVLTLTFGQGATMYSAGNIRYVGVSVLLIRRQVTAASESALQKTALTNPNGYIDFDLIETPFSIPLGTTAEQRFALPIPGQYANLMFRHYLGGSSVTRKAIDDGATLGSENRWRIETGSVVIREWRWKFLRALTEMNRPLSPVLIAPTLTATNAFIAATSAGSPTTALSTILKINPVQGVFGGGLASSAGFRNPCSVMLNFLTDGFSGDNATELGSLLDCNTPANNGLKMEIIGSPASAATNASYLKVLGRRYFGDLSKWQKFS